MLRVYSSIQKSNREDKCNRASSAVKTLPSCPQENDQGDCLIALRADHVIAETLRGTLLTAYSTTGKSTGLVIGIVGSNSGEGVSTVAANLAAMAADAAQRVLLIDGDARRRSLTKWFDSTSQSSSPIALDDMNLQYCLKSTGMNNVYLLPASAMDLTGDKRQNCETSTIQRAVERFRGTFDLLIVDLPSLLPLIEARSLAGALDCYLLIVEWGVTTIETLVGALASNPEVHKKMIGALFNKVDTTRLHVIDDATISQAVRFFGGQK